MVQGETETEAETAMDSDKEIGADRDTPKDRAEDTPASPSTPQNAGTTTTAPTGKTTSETNPTVEASEPFTEEPTNTSPLKCEDKETEMKTFPLMATKSTIAMIWKTWIWTTFHSSLGRNHSMTPMMIIWKVTI